MTDKPNPWNVWNHWDNDKKQFVAVVLDPHQMDDKTAVFIESKPMSKEDNDRLLLAFIELNGGEDKFRQKQLEHVMSILHKKD